MRTKVNLSSIKDCGQVWDEMEICKNGRKCEQCKQVITDFRGMTKWDIALVHAKSAQKVCGIYDKKSLKDSVYKPHKIKIRKLAFVPGLMGLMLASSQTSARTIIKTPQEIIHNSENSNLENKVNHNYPKENRDSLRILKGCVVDYNNEAIVGANVVVSGTTKGQTTDINGSFALDVFSEFENKDSLGLIVQYVGYGREIIHVNKEEFKDTMELNLDKIVIQEDFTLEAFGVGRESFPKRAWRSIKNVFRKKK